MTDYITVTSPPLFLSNWSYRKLHTISGSASGDLTDYQVRFTVYNTTGTDFGENVYLGSNVKPDFSDIRFTTTDNTPIPVWIQETGSNYAIVWVKVALPFPLPERRILWLPESICIVVLSDGAATFLFFDHFVGTAVNTTRWTKSGDVTVAGSVATLNAPDEKLTSVPVFGVNTILATRASINTAVWGLVGFGDDNNLAAIYANYPYSNSLNAINRLNSPSTQSSLTFLSGSGWNVLEIRRNPASTIYVVDVHGSISKYLLTHPADLHLVSGLRPNHPVGLDLHQELCFQRARSFFLEC